MLESWINYLEDNPDFFKPISLDNGVQARERVRHTLHWIMEMQNSDEENTELQAKASAYIQQGLNNIRIFLNQLEGKRS